MAYWAAAEQKRRRLGGRGLADLPRRADSFSSGSGSDLCSKEVFEALASWVPRQEVTAMNEAEFQGLSPAYWVQALTRLEQWRHDVHAWRDEAARLNHSFLLSELARVDSELVQALDTARTYYSAALDTEAE